MILIIEIPYAGMGDHLFHSHLPKIAKENGKYEKVFISSKSPIRNKEALEIIWEMNPYVDGFINQKGKSIDISELVNKVNPNSPTNLMDEIMLAYGLENGKRWNQPEIYYQPQFNEEFNKVVYDPNFLSWIGESTAQDAMSYFKKKKIQFEAVMKLRKGKHFYISTGQEKFIETPTLKEFCDLIFSAKKLYCLTSGTATLSSALQKKATVFYGNGQPAGFRHDKNHEYILVPRYLNNRLKKKLKLS